MASRSAVWSTGSVISLLSAQYWAPTLMPSTTQEEGATVLYTARLPQPCTVMVAAAPALDASQAKLCTAAPVLSMLTSPAHACPLSRLMQQGLPASRSSVRQPHLSTMMYSYDDIKLISTVMSTVC